MARDETELLAMGERIAELRESTGLKQQYIADYCGVKLRTYQFWQQGKHPPEQENLEKLAELFGVTPKYILRGHTPDPFAGSSEIVARLARIDERQDALRTQLSEVIGLLTNSPEARASLNDLIVRIIEDAVIRQGEKVGLRGRRPRQLPPGEGKRPAA